MAARCLLGAIASCIVVYRSNTLSRNTMPPPLPPRPPLKSEFRTESVAAGESSVSIGTCRDSETSRCVERAALGECDSSAAMRADCPVSCDACPLLEDDDALCKHTHDSSSIKPGMVHDAITRVASKHSSFSAKVLSKDPWLVVIDNFLSDDEVSALTQRVLQLCEGRWKSSSSFAGAGSASCGHMRSSTQCWGTSSAFLEDAVVGRIRERISLVTGTPVSHAEPLQVVRYEEQQRYRKHHDHIGGDATPTGARFLTFFVYLNTPEGGGATHFNDLNISVQALKGRAVLWPNVMDQRPELPELRTHHEATPITTGFKLGMNAWIRVGNFMQPWSRRCKYAKGLGPTHDVRQSLEQYVQARQELSLSPAVPETLEAEYVMKQHLAQGEKLIAQGQKSSALPLFEAAIQYLETPTKGASPRVEENSVTKAYYYAADAHFEAGDERTALRRLRKMQGKLTPLALATNFGNYGLAKLILDRELGRADELISGTQMTMIYLAAQYGHVDVARLLVIKGADSRRPYNGLTPLAVATEVLQGNSRAEMVALLRIVSDRRTRRSAAWPATTSAREGRAWW